MWTAKRPTSRTTDFYGRSRKNGGLPSAITARWSQARPDHVDSHRGPFLAISAYSRPGVIRRFVNTTDAVAAIEDILGLDRLSKFDYFSRPLSDVFAAAPDLAPYVAIAPAVDLKE